MKSDCHLRQVCTGSVGKRVGSRFDLSVYTSCFHDKMWSPQETLTLLLSIQEVRCNHPSVQRTCMEVHGSTSLEMNCSYHFRVQTTSKVHFTFRCDFFFFLETESLVLMVWAKLIVLVTLLHCTYDSALRCILFLTTSF